MMTKRYSLSLILPVYNEGENIRRVFKGLADYLQNQDIFCDYEVIVTDDGSRDFTSEALREISLQVPYLRIIRHPENLGYGRALMSGIGIAQFPLLFFMDADGQFDISELNKFIPYIDDYGIVTGYREKRRDNFYRLILGRIFTGLVFWLFGLKLRDVNCGFKLLKRNVLEEVNHSRGGAFYTEMMLKARDKGYKIKEIPVRHFSRLKGRQTGASLGVISDAIIDFSKLYIKEKLRR